MEEPELYDGEESMTEEPDAAPSPDPEPEAEQPESEVQQESAADRDYSPEDEKRSVLNHVKKQPEARYIEELVKSYEMLTVQNMYAPLDSEKVEQYIKELADDGSLEVVQSDNPNDQNPAYRAARTE